MNRCGFWVGLLLGGALLLAGCGGGGAKDPAREAALLTSQIGQLQAERKTLEDKIAQERAADKTQKEVTRRAVKIVRMFPIPLADVLTLPASVEAWQEIQISAQIAGVVDKIQLEEGDTVSKDQPLILLEAKQHQAALEIAQANLQYSDLQLARQQELQANNASKKEDFDLAQLNRNTAQANLELARLNLDWTKIKSPVDGVFDRRMVELGEYVSPGNVLGKVVHLRKVKALVNIPEKDVLYFEQGDKVKIVNDHPGAHEPVTTGVIDFLARAADPVTRTFPVKVAIENPQLDFRPGMIVRAELTRRENAAAIAVPFFTIIDREDGKGLFIEKDGVVHETKVQIGIIRGGLVEIVSGLNAGDHLVVVGQRELIDGEKVVVAKDITALAQSMLTSGKDLSQLVMQIY